VRTDGWVVTDTGVEIRLGGDLVFRNTRGELTRRIVGNGLSGEEMAVDATGQPLIRIPGVIRLGYDANDDFDLSGPDYIVYAQRVGNRTISYIVNLDGVVRFPNGSGITIYFAEPGCVGARRTWRFPAQTYTFRGVGWLADWAGVLGPPRTAYEVVGRDAASFNYRSEQTVDERTGVRQACIARVGSLTAGEAYPLGAALGTLTPPPGPYSYRLP